MASTQTKKKIYSVFVNRFNAGTGDMATYIASFETAEGAAIQKEIIGKELIKDGYEQISKQKDRKCATYRRDGDNWYIGSTVSYLDDRFILTPDEKD